MERFITLKHNQGSGSSGSHTEKGFGYFLKLTVLGILVTVEYVTKETEAVQCLTNFRLKYDDYQNNQDRAELLQHPAGHIQVKVAGCEIYERYNAKPQQYLNCTRATKPRVQLVQQKSHYQYIGNILNADGRDHSVAAPEEMRLGFFWLMAGKMCYILSLFL